MTQAKHKEEEEEEEEEEAERQRRRRQKEKEKTKVTSSSSSLALEITSLKKAFLSLQSSLSPTHPPTPPLVGRWLWKSGKRKMATQKGGWVLWEVGGRVGWIGWIVLEGRWMNAFCAWRLSNPPTHPQKEVANPLLPPPRPSKTPQQQPTHPPSSSSSPSLFLWQPKATAVRVGAGGLYQLTVGVYTSRKVGK